MAVRFAQGPAGGEALVQAGIGRQAERRSPLTVALAAAPPGAGAMDVNAPHAVYDLHADEIAAGKGLASAHATGFRYLVHTAGAPVAAAEVHADAQGNAPLLANINYGQFVGASASGFDEAAALKQAQDGNYEGRLLRFSAIPLMAIWLKADAGGADIIYPLAPAPDGLKANSPYSEADFLKVVVPLAKTRTATSPSHPVP